jgi:hypothetical protein
MIPGVWTMDPVDNEDQNRTGGLRLLLIDSHGSNTTPSPTEFPDAEKREKEEAAHEKYSSIRSVTLLCTSII